MTAGVLDSLGWSVGWTLLTLLIVREHGLEIAGLSGAAMLGGVALSAPLSAQLSRRLSGRQLLIATASGEAVLRVVAFVVLLAGWPITSLLTCIAATSAIGWTGYAAMRAEVAAGDGGARSLTWYTSAITAVEAAGIGVAALLPLERSGVDETVVLVAACCAASLVPTALAARRSPITASCSPHARSRLRLSGPATGGCALMLLCSGPTLLAVALTTQLHGRHAVVFVGAAFTAGCLLAPALAGRLGRAAVRPAAAWSMCALGVIAGWIAAPAHLALLCLAQFSSGLCMTTVEGLIDTEVADRSAGRVTGALAGASATRALGSAGAVALLPPAVETLGLQATAAMLSALVACSALVLSTRRAAAAGRTAGSGGRATAGWLRAQPPTGSPTPADASASSCCRSISSPKSISQ